jgi:prepilin-type N-terminal cleavage/methylation domain-containing protein
MRVAPRPKAAPDRTPPAAEESTPIMLSHKAPAATRSTRGFTLIELLVVVAIIGILAAIAIPAFASYRTRSINARLLCDLHNAALAQEAYFGDNDSYYTGSCVDLPPYAPSEGVTCTSEGDRDGVVITATHPQASVTCTYRNGRDTPMDMSCS